MGLTYFDKTKLNDGKLHPSMSINPNYCIARYLRDGKSCLDMDRAEAIETYEWYVLGNNSYNIVDEFDSAVTSYDFNEIVSNSCYIDSIGDASFLTIKDMYLVNEAEHIGLITGTDTFE